MRIAVLIAVSLLVAGCSQANTGRPEQPATTTNTASTAPHTTTATPSTTPSAPSRPPGAGAPISDVITWIEGGRPADAAEYHSATRDDVTTELSDDVAFTVSSGPVGSSGKTTCMTDSKRAGGALACLVDLADPPPRPETVYGEWKGNWVDFDGVSVQVGSVHGDPGRFSNGDGRELPYGAALSFGDYRCRADQAGLFCVDYAHRSAVRLAAAGVEPFGCLQSVPPSDGVGKKFSCDT